MQARPHMLGIFARPTVNSFCMAFSLGTASAIAGINLAVFTGKTELGLASLVTFWGARDYAIRQTNGNPDLEVDNRIASCLGFFLGYSSGALVAVLSLKVAQELSPSSPRPRG